MRYYDISRYLLDTYVPVSESHGFVFMQRRTTAVRGNRGLYFRAPSCDWGYAPNFFASSPEPSARALSLSFRTVEPGRAWEVELPEHGGRYQWLEVETAKPLRESRFVLSDREVVGDASETLDRLQCARAWPERSERAR